MGSMVYPQTKSVVLTMHQGGHHAYTHGAIDDQRDVPQRRIHSCNNTPNGAREQIDHEFVGCRTEVAEEAGAQD